MANRPIYIGNTKSGIALPVTPTPLTERGVETMANNQKIGNGSLMITVEDIQELIVGGSISRLRLQKRLPLPSMPAH
jgi:hypothetical protein